MDAALIKDIGTILAAVAAVLTALLGIPQYFQYRTRRDKMTAIGEAFNSVVGSLASDAEVERLAAAIRLRRFFDPSTELGVEGTPYATEAINVIAAVLRTQEPGNFQKLLADGLAYAPSLCRADLQRTNLQKAYLGVRTRGKGAQEDIEIDLTYADFYRADLSGASLKGARAKGAVFYEARLHNTVLSGSDLRDANFFEADLLGAKFNRAVLARANFGRARNVPPDLARKLDRNGLYLDEDIPFKADPRPQEEGPVRVFVSKPGVLDNQQLQSLDSISRILEEQDMVWEVLERSEYPRFGTLAEIRRRMSGCAGTVVLGFPQLEVVDGVWRSGTAEETQVTQVQLPTPWNQIEAGMAAMYGLPILLVCQSGMVSGIFGLDESERIFRVELPTNENSRSFQDCVANWCAAVREQAQR